MEYQHKLFDCDPVKLGHAGEDGSSFEIVADSPDYGGREGHRQKVSRRCIFYRIICTSSTRSIFLTLHANNFRKGMTVTSATILQELHTYRSLCVSKSAIAAW